jgi:hypothetical protein
MTGDTHLPVFVYCADHRPLVGLASRSRGLGSARARRVVILTLADVATRQYIFCRCSVHTFFPLANTIESHHLFNFRILKLSTRRHGAAEATLLITAYPHGISCQYQPSYIIYSTSERPNYLSESKITCGG